VAAILRGACIADKSLWIDEVFSLWISGQDLDVIWQKTASLDLHPPLYYTILHFWLSLGDSETAVRSLSAVLGILTVPIVYLIGRHVGSPALGLIAAALFVVSPLHLYYAQQARMYTMLTFFAAMSILCLLRVLDEFKLIRRRWPGRWWFGFVGSTTLVLLSHNTGVLEPASIALFVVLLAINRARRIGLRGVSTAAHAHLRQDLFTGALGAATGLTAVLVCWLPWLPIFLSQAQRVDAEFWLSRPTLTTLLDHWTDLNAAFLPDGRWHVLIPAGGTFLALCASTWLSRRSTLMLVVLLVAPAAGEYLISFRTPIFFTQTLVWTFVPLSVLLAAGILRLRLRPLTVLTASVALAISAIGVHGYHRYTGKEDWRGAVTYLAPRVGRQELILFSAGWAQLPFDYYLKQSGGPALVRHGLPADMFERHVLEPKMTSEDLPRLDHLLAGRSTVWVIYSHNWYTDPRGLVPSHLNARFEEVSVREFPGIEMIRYARPAALVAHTSHLMSSSQKADVVKHKERRRRHDSGRRLLSRLDTRLSRA
jgi:hypothetical protein